MKVIRNGSRPLDVDTDIDSVKIYRSNDLKEVYIELENVLLDRIFTIVWSVDDRKRDADWDSIAIVD